METISNIAYHGDLARKQEMENARPAEIDGKILMCAHVELRIGL